MTFRQASVVGAGLAGLRAAVTLAQGGARVDLSEAAARAGGRCRSYRDPALGLTIDNGNHLVLSGNRAVADFRAAIDAGEPLAGPDHADFAFADLGDGARWTVAVNDGRVPWWVLRGNRRVPGTGLGDYLPLVRLRKGGAGRIDALVPPRGRVWERFVRPVLLAALNTEPAEASARLAANVLRESLDLGGLASRPRVAVPTLAAAFVDPAVDWLAREGVDLAAGRRLRRIEFGPDRVTALEWADGRQEIGADHAVVLALPAWVAGELVPGLAVPDEHRAIVNLHYAAAPPPGAPAMLGLLGATAEWLFCHPDRLSVTISAADRLVDHDREALAGEVWAEVVRALALPADTPLPAWQVVKERRATFAATPAQDARRPGASTRWPNLFLAGDWVQTGLPATIEGALRSGDEAARLVLGMPMRYGPARC